MARMLNALRMIDCSISGLKAMRPTAIAISWTDRRVEKPIDIKRPIPGRHPQDNHRRNDQRASDIAEPPCERDGREVRELGGSSKDQAADPEGGTDDSPRPKTKQSEFRNGARGIERPGATRPDGHQISADDRLQRVADWRCRRRRGLAVKACVGNVVRRIRDQGADERWPARPEDRGEEWQPRRGRLAARPGWRLDGSTPAGGRPWPAQSTRRRSREARRNAWPAPGDLT